MFQQRTFIDNTVFTFKERLLTIFTEIADWGKKKKKIIKDNGGKNLYPLYYYFFLFLFNISIRTCSLKFIFQWTYLEINAEHILKTFATNFAMDCYYSQSRLWLVVDSISSPASICQAMEMSQII